MELCLALSSISKKFTERILNLTVARALKGRSDLSTRSYKVNFGTGKGEGYIGIVYRISVLLSDGSSLSLVGKGLPPNMVRRKTFQCESFFATEVAFYNKFAPVLRDFEVKQRGPDKVASDTFLPIAECYYAMSDGVNDFLVFQDLNTLGFGMANRISGPSNSELKALLHTLARFHALSLALQVVDPDAFAPMRDVKEPWFTMDQDPRFSGFFYKVYKLWHRAIEDELKNTECLKNFEELGPDSLTLFERVCASVRPLEPSVMTHGDIWSTNFLFKGEEVKMIDFQMSRYCSAVSDLAVFIFSCTNEEQRQAAGGTGAILKDYFAILTEAVKELKVAENPLTWEKFQDHWKICGLNGFATAMKLVPLSLVEPEDVQDLDQMEGEDAVDLILLTEQFKDITAPLVKKRLVDLTKMAFHYKLF